MIGVDANVILYSGTACEQTDRARTVLADDDRIVVAQVLVEIVRRNKPVAGLVPVESDAEPGRPVSWAGHAERMRELWGGQSVSVLDQVLDDLRAEP